MNVEETIRLCRVIEALSPSQTFTEETPAVWQVILSDVTLADALEAAKALGKRQPYIAPADLVAETSRLRTRRLDDVGVPTPNVDPDDARAYAEELRALTAMVASGQMDRGKRARYEAGGITLTGVQPRYALGSEMIARPAITAALGNLFRESGGNRPRPKHTDRPADDPAKRLDSARARLDAQAQA